MENPFELVEIKEENIYEDIENENCDIIEGDSYLIDIIKKESEELIRTAETEGNEALFVCKKEVLDKTELSKNIAIGSRNEESTGICKETNEDDRSVVSKIDDLNEPNLSRNLTVMNDEQEMDYVW